MKEETREKIIESLVQIEKIFVSQQLKSDKKLTSLLDKKNKYQELKKLEQEYRELLRQEAVGEEENFQSEIEELQRKIEETMTGIKEQIIAEEGTEQNIVMEIRPGTGGTEAGLFARDLYAMYSKFAGKKQWKLEMVESKVDHEGNFVFVAFLVKGTEVFKYLKNEAGVHRVQRVPRTESKGRIHTSTVTVVVLPEAKDVAVEIKPAELRIDSYRSSGAGGQHVNTTDSAVRITHLPTGIVATSQDGRSQHDNKARALFILKSRLLEKLHFDKEKELGNLRSSMIGTAERSEKIRTYNYPQNRVTDHRLGMSWNKLNFIMEGDLEELGEKLIDYEVVKGLEKLISQISGLKSGN